MESLSKLIKETIGFKSKKGFYRDRNSVILWALKEFQENGGEVGWKEADDTDDKWVVVWAKLPEGQVGWHIPRESIKIMGWLEKEYIPYDGHTNSDKLNRLLDYLQEEIRLEEHLEEDSDG